MVLSLNRFFHKIRPELEYQETHCCCFIKKKKKTPTNNKPKPTKATELPATAAKIHWQNKVNPRVQSCRLNFWKNKPSCALWQKNPAMMFRINIPSNAKCTFPAHAKSVKLPGRHVRIQPSMENGHCHGDGSVSEKKLFLFKSYLFHIDFSRSKE